MIERKVFPVWKTIELLFPEDEENGFLSLLEKSGCNVTSGAMEILGQLLDQEHLIAEEGEIDLVVVSVAELDFKKEPRFFDILRRLQRFDLDLCLGSVGPELRRQYLDQPEDEDLYVAMEPVLTGHGQARTIFRLRRDSCGLWLETFSAEAFEDIWYADFWSLEAKFVCRKLK